MNNIFKLVEKQRTQKKSELQMMGIEPMTFRILVGRSITKTRELLWQAQIFFSSLTPHDFKYRSF